MGLSRICTNLMWDRSTTWPVVSHVAVQVCSTKIGMTTTITSWICLNILLATWYAILFHSLGVMLVLSFTQERREPRLASNFDRSAKEAKEWFDSQSRIEKYPKFDDYFMNIGEEMALLTEIKDIRNELSMISTVLTDQTCCLENLSEAIQQ